MRRLMRGLAALVVAGVALVAAPAVANGQTTTTTTRPVTTTTTRPPTCGLPGGRVPLNTGVTYGQAVTLGSPTTVGSLTVRWGDGTTTTNATRVYATHTYAAQGAYVVTATSNGVSCGSGLVVVIRQRRTVSPYWG